MKRNMSVSFDEEIWEKLREMRNSSDFINNLVTREFNSSAQESDVCEYCGKSSKERVWICPDEKHACLECEGLLIWKAKHSGALQPE